jgi:hypothetical protein
MYIILNTLFAAVLFYIGVTNIDSGYLWTASLFVSGLYFGHLLTDALNQQDDV